MADGAGVILLWLFGVFDACWGAGWVKVAGHGIHRQREYCFLACSDTREGYGARGLGAVAFWDEKCWRKKMQNARIVVAVVRSERGVVYVGSFASRLSHNLLILASLSDSEVKLVAPVEVRSAIKPALYPRTHSSKTCGILLN